jgi:K+-sensing histidine kinase KdpD
MKSSTGESVGLGLGFAGLAVGVAAAMVPLREELGSANPALVMVLVVVAAATVGGRTAGAVCALTASLAFNFFYTKPYLTLRVNSGKDILTIVLILGVGLAVGELGVARSRQSATRRSHLRSIRSLEQVGALVTGGADAETVWPAVRDALVVSLGLSSARFEAGAPTLTLPVMERDGRVDVHEKRYIGDGFALPDLGVLVNVEADGQHLGQIVLEPNPEIGVTREQRRAAVAIADQFAIALRKSPQIRSFV